MFCCPVFHKPIFSVMLVSSSSQRVGLVWKVQGEVGWESMGGTTFFFWSSGGLSFPSPQTHPSPSHTLFCPINWHTPLATPSKANQMGRTKCTWSAGVWWEHPVWAKFTCPFPTPVTCALQKQSTTRRNPDTDELQAQIGDTRHSQLSMSRRNGSCLSSDLVNSASPVTYLWICVSLLTEASAALHSGHFTLLLICGRTVCKFT